MKLVEAAESGYIAHLLGSGSGVHSGAGPPSAGDQTSSDSKAKHQHSSQQAA